jgi:hypothetical protein
MNFPNRFFVSQTDVVYLTQTTMKLTPKITKAINLAATLHDGQERKGDGLPYIVHPVSVALILMDYTDDEDVIIAGILHDTIEDTSYTGDQMEKVFGSHVTELVLDVTEKDKDLPWQQRKDDYLKHLLTSCHESKLICAADKLHNLQSMLEAFQKFGEKALEKFNAPVDKKLWFYKECLKIFKNDKDMSNGIIEAIESVLKDLKALDQPEPKRKILFIECENEKCGFGVEFKHENETFFFCKDCKFGVNVSSDQLDDLNHMCGSCKKKMERYDLYDEDNVCPICNDMIGVCFEYKKTG